MKFLELIIKNKETFVYGGMLLPNIFLYSLFLIKLHPFPLVLLKYFALNSSVPGSGFSFF